MPRYPDCGNAPLSEVSPASLQTMLISSSELPAPVLFLNSLPHRDSLLVLCDLPTDTLSNHLIFNLAGLPIASFSSAQARHDCWVHQTARTILLAAP